MKITEIKTEMNISMKSINLFEKLNHVTMNVNQIKIRAGPFFDFKILKTE